MPIFSGLAGGDDGRAARLVKMMGYTIIYSKEPAACSRLPLAAISRRDFDVIE